MDKGAALLAVAEKIVASGVTPHLQSSAKQLVPGAGNPDADILFIGEAPGAKEDELGEPFVGAAGKFLNEMLASVGLDRGDVFITNIVKYRPPDNRDPEPAEIEAFWPYLQEQIKIIQPTLIVPLGRHAMSVFLPGLVISQVHGQPKRKNGQVYLPLYHPASALYNGSMRTTLMDDFARVPQILQLIKSS